MLRFTSPALAAFAATLYVAVGLRSEHHPVWWHEHPASSAEILQELLTTSLAAAGATAQDSKEEPGDAEAQERTLRELVSTIRQDWRGASASVCHQQLGRLVNNLTLACEGLQPKADWIVDFTSSTARPFRTRPVRTASATSSHWGAISWRRFAFLEML